MIKQDIEVDIRRQHTTLTIQNNCGAQEDGNLFFSTGMKLCPELQIVSTGCTRNMDLLTLTVQPELNKKEKVFIPVILLKRHKVTLFNTDNGFTLYGLATIDQYTELLDNVKYVNMASKSEDISRTITVSFLC